MLEIYAADISVGDYGDAQLEIMSDVRKQKYLRLKCADDRRRCATVAFLLHKARPQKNEGITDGGKPTLEDEYISVSHSGRWVFVAVSDYPVGIDAEEIRTVDHEALAKRIFSRSEQKQVVDNETFFSLWTRKESMLKKLGVGLAKLTTETAEHRFFSLDGFEGYSVTVCSDCDRYILKIV